MIAGAASETALSRVAAPGAWLLVLGFLVGLTPIRFTRSRFLSPTITARRMI
jgi:hypothetical protein